MSVTPHRETRRSLLRASLTLVALALLTVSATSCGDASSGSASAPRVYDIVVPLGTQDRLARGETVSLMPTRLEFKVGDTLRIRNDDTVAQTVGPYRVQAGTQFELKYSMPGQYGGVCALSKYSRFEIVITE